MQNQDWMNPRSSTRPLIMSEPERALSTPVTNPHMQGTIQMTIPTICLQRDITETRIGEKHGKSKFRCNCQSFPQHWGDRIESRTRIEWQTHRQAASSTVRTGTFQVMNASNQPLELGSDGNANNPIKKSFDDFRRNTPWVTQALMMATIVSWFLGLFLPKYLLECIPYFIMQKFEVYRLVTSIFVNPDLFSNIFACLMLAQHGRTIEEAMGSACTLWLGLGVFTVLVNILYFILQLARTSITTSSGDTTSAVEDSTAGPPLLWETPGIWTVVMGIIAVESCRAAQFQPQRSFCNCWKVPTKFYPLCLLLIVALMTSRSIVTLFTSTGLGYLIGLNLDYGFLSTPNAVASFCDNTFRGGHGWISATAISGSEAWGQEREPLFPGLPTLQGSHQPGESHSMPTNAQTLPETAGRALGGASQRNIDARTARLQALERQNV